MAPPIAPTVDPATGQVSSPYSDRTLLGMLRYALDEDTSHIADNRLQSIVRDSSLAVWDRGYRQAFTSPGVDAMGKAGYVAGRLVKDVINDGSRVPWWVMNHPMAQTAVASDLAADAAGLNPDYDVWHQKLEGAGETRIDRTAIDRGFAKEQGFSFQGEGEGLPFAFARRVPAILGASTMLATSGNTNFLNVTGGGRLNGFQSVLPVEGDPTRSSNPLAELGARYLFGRTGRLLDWDQFTQERPDVSPQDYEAYRAYQFDKGPLLGVFKATSRNIDAEPEFTMMGFRVPLSAAAQTGGVLVGGIAGAKAADQMINANMRERFGGHLRASGNRRLAGFALGALLGGVSGRLSAQAANDLVIQPSFNPDRQLAAQQWTAEQQAKGLL